MKFKMVPETLYLTVILIDRYLEKKQVRRSRLQLVGVAALLVRVNSIGLSLISLQYLIQFNLSYHYLTPVGRKVRGNLSTRIAGSYLYCGSRIYWERNPRDGIGYRHCLRLQPHSSYYSFIPMSLPESCSC